MTPIFSKLDHSFAAVIRPFGAVLALVTRLGVGSAFFMHGLGKLQNLDKTTAGFESLGIPLPGINAPFVGGLELVGGAALVLGIATRPFAALLSATMIVALISAHTGDLKTALTFSGEHGTHFIDISAMSYLLLCLWIWYHGAGRLSVDSMIFDTQANEHRAKK